MYNLQAQMLAVEFGIGEDINKDSIKSKYVCACMESVSVQCYVCNSCKTQTGQRGNAWLPCCSVWVLQLFCHTKYMFVTLHEKTKHNALEKKF